MLGDIPSKLWEILAPFCFKNTIPNAGKESLLPSLSQNVSTPSLENSSAVLCSPQNNKSICLSSLSSSVTPEPTHSLCDITKQPMRGGVSSFTLYLVLFKNNHDFSGDVAHHYSICLVCPRAWVQSSAQKKKNIMDLLNSKFNSEKMKNVCIVFSQVSSYLQMSCFCLVVQ